jgi:hypothetical protein
MKHVRTLAALNGRILRTYSQRTCNALATSLPLRLVLPRIEPMLALNVAKEVCKDTLVMRRAGEAFASGCQPDRAMARRLFEETKDIDRGFVEQARGFPVAIVIRYDEIAPIRTERIERLQTAVHRVLEAASQAAGIRRALQSAFSSVEFERQLYELLRLYAEETRVLTRSFGLPAPLAMLRELLLQSLYTTMNETAVRMSREAAAAVYRLASPRG